MRCSTVQGLWYGSKERFLYTGGSHTNSAAETLGLKAADIRRLNVLSMKCLRSIAAVTQMEKIREENVQIRTDEVRKLSAVVDTTD